MLIQLYYTTHTHINIKICIFKPWRCPVVVRSPAETGSHHMTNQWWPVVIIFSEKGERRCAGACYVWKQNDQASKLRNFLFLFFGIVTSVCVVVCKCFLPRVWGQWRLILPESSRTQLARGSRLDPSFETGNLPIFSLFVFFIFFNFQHTHIHTQAATHTHTHTHLNYIYLYECHHEDRKSQRHSQVRQTSGTKKLKEIF